MFHYKKIALDKLQKIPIYGYKSHAHCYYNFLMKCIENSGLLEPIAIADGMVINGRARIEAIRLLKLENTSRYCQLFFDGVVVKIYNDRWLIL